MLTSKRIDGDYSIVSTSGGTITLGAISTDPVIIPGNLTVQGITTSVNTTDLNITDNIIVLNDGETGPGVTLGSAGITISRGDGVSSGQEFASILYNEATDIWELDQGDGVLVAISTGGDGIANVVEDTSPQIGGSGGLDMRSNRITTSDVGQNIALTLPGGNSNAIVLNALHTNAEIILNGPTVIADPILILSQNETSYDNILDNGTFVGGDGAGGTAHVAADVLTLSNGATITVDVVDGDGDVTDFTVLSIGTAIVYNVALTQTGSTGTGDSFTLTPKTINITGGLGTTLTHGTDTGGGTQIHYQNDTDTGELVSKTKAMVFGLIF